MLSCSKIIGRLSKVARHTHADDLFRPLKYIDAIGINSAYYSNDRKDEKPSKPIGTTVKADDGVTDTKAKNIPPCELNASCPPSYYENCEKRHNGPKQESNKTNEKDNKSQLPKYWKQTLAALIITGVSIYSASSNWYKSDGSEKSSEEISKAEDKRPRMKIKVPAESNLIPQEIPYLLIGGGTAAFSAFRSIKSRDPKAKVLVITDEETHPYMRPPLTKELWFSEDREISKRLDFVQWNGVQRSIFYEPEEFYSNVDNLAQSDKGGVAVARGWKVKKIDVANKTVFLDDDYAIKYDKCLIATGASPKTLPLFETANGEVKEKIMTFRTNKDFLKLEENLDNPNCKNVVIIGGGFLGSELACALAQNYKDKKVFQVYKEKFIMAQILPEYLSKWTTQKIQNEGVNCIPSTEVKDFSYKNGRLSLILSGNNAKKKIDADQVIVAVGAQPNTDLAKMSGLEVDPENGGLIVNAELEARSNLWVAGDAASFYDIRFDRRRRVEHHDHAVCSGRVAGDNMAGVGQPYQHLPMFWSDLGPEVGYEATGIIDSSLRTVGVFAKETKEDTPVEKEATSQETLATETGNVNQTSSLKSKETSTQPDHPNTGVIFYLRDNVVVGVLLWNIFNRIPIAKQVIMNGTKYDDITEVAKLFNIHDN